MGNPTEYRILIDGVSVREDAEATARELVTDLKAKGHGISQALFYELPHGEGRSLLPQPQPPLGEHATSTSETST